MDRHPEPLSGGFHEAAAWEAGLGAGSAGRAWEVAVPQTGSSSVLVIVVSASRWVMT